MLSAKFWRWESSFFDATLSYAKYFSLLHFVPWFLSRYAWANLFILPGTILFCFLGATAGSLADSGASGDSGVVTIVTIVVGVVFGVLAIVVVSFYAKKELNKVREFIRMLNLFIFCWAGLVLCYMYIVHREYACSCILFTTCSLSITHTDSRGAKWGECSHRIRGRRQCRRKGYWGRTCRRSKGWWTAEIRFPIYMYMYRHWFIIFVGNSSSGWSRKWPGFVEVEAVFWLNLTAHILLFITGLD